MRNQVSVLQKLNLSNVLAANTPHQTNSIISEIDPLLQCRFDADHFQSIVCLFFETDIILDQIQLHEKSVSQIQSIAQKFQSYVGKNCLNQDHFK